MVVVNANAARIAKASATASDLMLQFEKLIENGKHVVQPSWRSYSSFFCAGDAISGVSGNWQVENTIKNERAFVAGGDDMFRSAKRLVVRRGWRRFLNFG